MPDHRAYLGGALPITIEGEKCLLGSILVDNRAYERVGDFLKRTSMMGCGADGLAKIGPAAVILAREEGLETHALSVSLRLGTGSDG